MGKELYFDDCMTYGSLRRALNRCCRNVRWKDSVIGYELHAPQRTHELLKAIRGGTYKISPYQRFIINEPKRREIVATRIADRQVQMALCEGGLYDDLVEHFIYDNCACQKGNGTDFCLKRIRKHLADFVRKHGSNGYVLKLDVHHFFPSTLHEVAKNAVKKRVTDQKACAMVCDVIDSFGGDRGIGLGSQISQLVELAVLDDLDHFIKEQLHIKHYVRYMDDFVLIHEDKEYLKYCWKRIGEELEKIGLELNEKSTLYPLSQGMKFLQWRFIVTESGKIVQKISPKKMGKQRRKMKKILYKEEAGEYAVGTALTSLTAWCANAARGDSYFQRRRMKHYYYTVKAGIENGKRQNETAESRT